LWSIRATLVRSLKRDRMPVHRSNQGRIRKEHALFDTRTQRAMMKWSGRVLLGAALAAMPLAGGCKNDGQGPNSFFDPTAVGNFNYNAQPLIIPIMQDLDIGVAESEPQFANATPPRPEDLEVIREDYRIGRQDVVAVSITDLVAPGVE